MELVEQLKKDYAVNGVGKMLVKQLSTIITPCLLCIVCTYLSTRTNNIFLKIECYLVGAFIYVTIGKYLRIVVGKIIQVPCYIHSSKVEVQTNDPQFIEFAKGRLSYLYNKGSIDMEQYYSTLDYFENL